MRVTLCFLSDPCFEFHRKSAEKEEGVQEAALGRGAEASNYKKKLKELGEGLIMSCWWLCRIVLLLSPEQECPALTCGTWAAWQGWLAFRAGLLGSCRMIIPWPASPCLDTRSAALQRQMGFRRIMSSSCSSSPTCISSGLRANTPLRGNFLFSLSWFITLTQ